MLKHLLIENYALIQKLDAEFLKGLTVITGETGAGKSILLGALSLILGQRADTRVLRDQKRKCIIEGTFDVSNYPVRELFEENDLDYDHVSVFRREITPAGKSRAFINDTPVNLALMNTITSRLIDIHSQHESLLLGKSSFQFDVVDGYASIESKVESYRKQFSRLLAARRELEMIEAKEKSSRADLDYFNFQFEELEKAALDPVEYSQLEPALELAKNAGDIRYSLEKALWLLQGEEGGAGQVLGELTVLFKPLTSYGTTYEELAGRIDSLLIETRDIQMEIERLKEGIFHDEAETARLESRMDQINKLLLKHQVQDVESLIKLKNEYQDKISDSVSLEHQIEKLTLQLTEDEKNLMSMAAEISAARKAAIPGIQKHVLSMLKDLGMPHASFVIHHEVNNALGYNGTDLIRFLFNANKGGDLQEVSRIASGGELSRFMLSIKSMISLRNLLPTIIFDEIDTGISGEISTRMANILEDMANDMQVIVITHLPQIAARGKHHLLVQKKVDGEHTNTFVKHIDQKERILEIAKMLGGENPTKVMEETAKELIFNRRKTII